MKRGQRSASWEADTCAVCPAQLLGAGEFDVTDRPGRDSRYEPTAGYRVNAVTAAPTCVHPYRVGLMPGAYASTNAPLPQASPPPAPEPAHLELPTDADDLEGWCIAMLRVVEPEEMASALARAEATAVTRFPARQVVAVLRKVWASELARQH
ncbi:hypothetical protein Val02_69310 [Virgisporangium aliadipatigenens]|uniref:Uncharacterized protein n=1 Tax=Virgisporangium aliadipatigenens TaxID=741659 RepID=A0A8J3YUE3_9ACTN|nr:hypothetical protein [Virgisporangium aliadipatigenens]GIJ50045.1 hypothetical protein Val02_69310 [Virgisporangium aliadipatigenens]